MVDAERQTADSMFAQLRGLALGFLRDKITTGVGGSPELGAFFPCMGRIIGDGMVLGSCVLLRGGRLALTAAHVVRAQRRLKPYLVRFDSGKAVADYDVVAIHWRSGEVFDSARKVWPTHVGSYSGALDRLVAVELESEIPELIDATAPYLPKALSLMTDDVLVTVGFGEDVIGNHPDGPWAGVTRFRGMDDDGFANHINRRSDLFNGMPRAGDSGAAVFWPPLSNPRPPHHLRLVGVHSGRRATAEGEVAAYIPIDPASEEWIRRIDAQAAAAATTRPKKPPSNVSPTKCHFRHRATLPCWHFPDPPAEIAGVDLDLSTKGKNELLAHASKLKLEVAGQQLRMLLTQPKLGPVSVMLHRDTIGPGGHWYTNDDGTNDCYYLFLVDSRAKPQKPDDRRSPVIHIEAFKAGSCQPRPSSCTIWDDTGTKRLYCQQDEPEPWDAKPCRSDDATFFQDQDDEGNGHDPP